MSISVVSAFNFDNIKKFDKDVGKYGRIKITNAFGFGSTLAEYTLIDNSDYCMFDCYAEGIAKLHFDGRLFDEINFYGNKKDKKTISNNAYYKKNNKWLEYTGEILKTGEYEWRIKGKKLGDENIDWIVSTFGEDLTEWAWWNSSFSKKKAITITENNNTDLFNYSILINVTYDSNMASDFSDLRFANSTDDSELSYYIQKKNDSDFAEVWVKFERIEGNDDTIFYMYYDNETTTSTTSNFTRAFVYADDFNSDTSSNWQTHANCEDSGVENGFLFINESDNGQYCTTGPASAFQLLSTNYFVEANMTLHDNAAYLKLWGYGNSINSPNANDAYSIIIIAGGLDWFRLGIILTDDIDTATFSPTAGVWHDLSLKMLGNVQNASMLNPSQLQTNGSSSLRASGFYGIGVQDSAGGSVSKSVQADWFRIRPAVGIEPTYAFGSEDILNIHLNQPPDNSTAISVDMAFNSSLTPDLQSETNHTNGTIYIWFSNDTLFNFTEFELSGNETNSTSIIVNDLELGESYIWNEFICYTNSTEDYCEWAPFNFTFLLDDFVEVSRSFNPQTIEGSVEEFILNISVSSSTSLSSAIFWYEDVPHGSIITGTETSKLITNSIPIPDIGPQTNNSFFWQLLFGFDSKNTTSSNQSVSNISIDDCTTNTHHIFNYSLIDEEAQTNLTQNTSIDLFINIFSLDRTISVLNFSNNFSHINPVSICLNENLTNTSISYVVDSTVKYSDDDHVVEYYNTINSTLDNQTTEQNIILRDLLSDDSTEFQLTFTGSDFLAVENALIFVKRQYVDESTFKLVELPKTDSGGQTIVHLVRNDVVYNIEVVKDGIVVGNFENIIAFCDDFSIGDCKISLDAFSTGDPAFDYDDVLGISFKGPSYNNETKIISFSFISIDGSAKSVLMNATRNDIFGNVSICSASTISIGATLTCTVPDYIDDSLIITKVFVGEVETVKTYLKLEDLNFGTIGYFIFFIYMLMMILMFSKSKTTMLIGIILGFVSGISLGLIGGRVVGVGASGIWLILIIILMLWKLNKGRPN